jgi:hypothetical protein
VAEDAPWAAGVVPGIDAVTTAPPDALLATAAALAAGGRGPTVVVVGRPPAVAATLAAAVGAPPDAPSPFIVLPGSVSVVEVPAGDGGGARAALRCANWGGAGV